MREITCDFFYGEGSNGFIIGLGGNQGDSIKFSDFKGMRYVVPVSYYDKYKKTKNKTMKKFDMDELNKEFSINEKTQKNESTR